MMNRWRFSFLLGINFWAVQFYSWWAIRYRKIHSLIIWACYNLRNLSSADTVAYVWICYSSLLLCRLKCCLLIFQKIIRNCLWVGLSSQLQRSWPSVSTEAKFPWVSEWRQVMWGHTGQLVKLPYSSTSCSSRGSRRVLSVWVYFDFPSLQVSV